MSHLGLNASSGYMIHFLEWIPLEILPNFFVSISIISKKSFYSLESAVTSSLFLTSSWPDFNVAILFKFDGLAT